MQAGSVALEGRVGTCLILLPTVQPAQGGMVLESQIVTYPHACRSMHMTVRTHLRANTQVSARSSHCLDAA